MQSFLVIGAGRFGSSVATELYNLKHEVLAIDTSEERITRIMKNVTEVMIGDAKDEAVLRSLGVSNFDCVIVAIAEKQLDSIIITMMLKELGARTIVCKANDELHAKILSQIGANKVIRPEYDMGKQVAHSITFPIA